MPEMSLTGFIAHLAGFQMRLAEAEHKALEHAAKLVEAEAKREVGHYQDAAGPFQAWPELADATKADRLKHGFSENDPLLRTGEMRDSIGHAIGDKEAAIGSNNDKAVWQELGTSSVPPRSFLGAAGVRKSEEVAEILGMAPVIALVGHSVSGKLTRSD